MTENLRTKPVSVKPTLVGEAKNAWHQHKYGNLPHQDLVAGASWANQVGLLEEIGTETGRHENDREIFVRLEVETEAGLKTLADMVTEYRRSRPVLLSVIIRELDPTFTREQARERDPLGQGSAVSQINFLKANNSQIDFSRTDASVDEIRRKTREIKASGESNYRDPYNQLMDTLEETHDLVNGHIAGQVTTMANSMGVLDEFQPRITKALEISEKNWGRRELRGMVQELENREIVDRVTTMANSMGVLDEFQPQITEALADADNSKTRRELLAMARELVSLHGAEDPAWDDSSSQQQNAGRPHNQRSGQYGHQTRSFSNQPRMR